MDLRDLRYFETIAELQHMGKATERLHRTQPALSSAVRRLEQACGAPLFERSGRGICLTSAGRVLLKWAQRMRFDMEDARREIADIGKGLSGHVRVGFVPTAAQFLLPPAARELMQRAPEVTLSCVTGLIDALRAMVYAGELDLMVVTEAGAHEDLVAEVLSEDVIVVAAGLDHAIHRGPVRMQDLGQHRWVLQPPGAPTRDWLDQAFDRQHLPRPRAHIESTMLVMHPALIAESGLLSFISRKHVGPDQGIRTLREVPVPELTMSRRMVASYRASAYLSPATRLFLDMLRQVS